MQNSNLNNLNHFEGFMPIHTIFYSIFHPTEGTKVCYEFPPKNLSNFHINFDTIKNYIIPKNQLCNRLLTFKYENYRIVSYPITINAPYYARNFFSFNFVFVFPYECETSPYEPSIARLGKMFKILEEQSQILSKAENDPIYFKSDYVPTEPTTTIIPQISPSHRNKRNNDHNDNNDGSRFETDFFGEEEDGVTKFSVQDLIMRIYQDLNNYSECLIPIDKGNDINIKVFPLLKPPPNHLISLEDVPMSLINLNNVIDVNWDPTMLNIVPYINGVNDISKIAKLTKADPLLVIECIKHLVYYNCVIITDIFQFSNVYAPTSLICSFLTDQEMATQCQNYVVLPIGSKLSHLPFENNGNKQPSTPKHSRTTSLSSSMSGSVNSHEHSYMDTIQKSETSLSLSSTDPNNPHFELAHLPTKACLFDLYRSLSYGVTLRSWYQSNATIITENNVDVRKFIKFGIIRGLIYRCHSYPIPQRPSNEGIQRIERLNDIDAHRLQIRSSGSAARSNSGSGSGSSASPSSINVDGADELLKNVYKKLERHSKVSFMDKEKNESMKTDEKGRPSTMTKEERSVLLKSIESLENLDKICVKLGKSRQQVERWLDELGNYKIITC
ncbi:hypothetical protein NCAS_0H00870 [Naumovozyma castellii]|uniref:Nitrogen permease regulator 2 n=1 Tax=Naumovozyma castellii TaxID=27288 RepID=G0VIS0_NAUCA|nr:hypothetical protein NCAS_0H00870 [Naumovozyma castellii CBS 4309]CCC71397.1 hypothetical protein NCAS_0H00870 [Naumovozyma castellii CBS 4309]